MIGFVASTFAAATRYPYPRPLRGLKHFRRNSPPSAVLKPCPFLRPRSSPVVGIEDATLSGSTFKLSVQVSDFQRYEPSHPACKPLCGCCSSGQRFACSFLQIPPRDGHPCRPANYSPCRASRGLSPPSKSALPGAHKKKAPPKSNGRANSLSERKRIHF